MRLFWL